MSWQINSGNVYVKSVGASRSMSHNIAQRTGLSEIEWSCAFLPVLAIEEGIDLRKKIPVGMRAQLVNRSDLADRLGVDAGEAIGAQLVSKAVLSYYEGCLVDGEMFRDRLLHLRLRIDDSAENVPALLDEYKIDGLIEEIDDEKKYDGYLFVELCTKSFCDLAKKLTVDIPGLAVLLSMNDSILYLEGGNT